MADSFSPLYAPAAFGYYLVQKSRELLYKAGVFKPRKTAVPVVSVGNLLMGGSGKTPFVIFLAELMKNQGFRPAVVSRGYGGSSREKFLIVSNGDGSLPGCDASRCGDEPYMIALNLPDIPVLIGRKRINPARVAHELLGCDIIILDDGFQHLQLHRDADIVLLNGSEDWMFPLGYLREPLSALNRADIIVRSNHLPPSIERFSGRLPCFRAGVVADAVLTYDKTESISLLNRFEGRHVTLVSGIADPQRFELMALDLNWKISQHIIYKDHHTMSGDDLQRISFLAEETPVVFTEKDWVKLPDRFKRGNVAALRIRTSVDDPTSLFTEITKLITRDKNVRL